MGQWDDETQPIIRRPTMTPAEPKLEDAASPNQIRHARAAYRVYGEVTGGLNYQGLPMPEFDALPLKIRMAWCSAAAAVVLSALDVANERVMRSHVRRYRVRVTLDAGASVSLTVVAYTATDAIDQARTKWPDAVSYDARPEPQTENSP